MRSQFVGPGFHPGTVYEDLTKHLNNPTYDAKPLYFTLGIALLLAIAHFVFPVAAQRARSLEEIKAWGHRH